MKIETVNNGTTEFPFYTIMVNSEEYCSTSSIKKAENLVKLLSTGLVRKRYKFTFKDEDGSLIIVNEDSERKAFKKAFRTYETPKDRELTIVSKELNV